MTINNPNQNSDELKKIVTQTLQSSGILGKLKSQLRASVFDVLQGREKENVYFRNKMVERMKGDPDALLASQLICDFMSFYKMDYSLGVFRPEADIIEDENGNTRKELEMELEKRSKRDTPQFSDKQPLLVQILVHYLSSSDQLIPFSEQAQNNVTREPSSSSSSSSSGLQARNLTKPKETLSSLDESLTLGITRKPAGINNLGASETFSSATTLETQFDDDGDFEELTNTVQREKRPTNNSDCKTLHGGDLISEIRRQSLDGKPKESRLEPISSGLTVLEPISGLGISKLAPLQTKPNPLLSKSEHLSPTQISDASQKSTNYSNSLLSNDRLDSRNDEQEWKSEYDAYEDDFIEEDQYSISEDFSEDFDRHSANDFSDHTANSEHFDYVEKLDEDSDDF